MVLIWTTFNPDSVTPEKKSFGNTRTLNYLSTGLTSIHPSPSPYTQLGLSRPRRNTLHLLNITMFRGPTPHACPPLPYGHHSSLSPHRHRAAAHNSLLHHAERCCPSRQHNTDGNGQRVSVAVLTSAPKCHLSRCLVPESTWGRKTESF